MEWDRDTERLIDLVIVTAFGALVVAGACAACYLLVGR